MKHQLEFYLLLKQCDLPLHRLVKAKLIKQKVTLTQTKHVCHQILKKAILQLSLIIKIKYKEILRLQMFEKNNLCRNVAVEICC